MEAYIKQLLAEKGVPQDLEQEVQDKLVADLSARAGHLIDRRLIDAMPDDSVAEFTALVEKDDTTPEQLQAFTDKHVPDKQKIVTDALMEFRKLYLGEA